MATRVRPATLPARLPPALVAAAAAAGCAFVAVVDPNEPGRYPTCPFLLATGRWCPGCGTLRGVRALLQGDLTRAADLNLLLVLSLPVALSAWLLWALTAWGLRAPRARRLPVPAVGALLAAMLAFGVLRNLPGFAWLAP